MLDTKNLTLNDDITQNRSVYYGDYGKTEQICIKH